jgi:PKD repeat protein
MIIVSHRSRLIVGMVATLLLSSAAATILPSSVRAAEPNGFGQLTRFGETAENLGEAGKLAELNTRLIGVDPTDNSVYVLDETKQPTGIKRFLRLQKFKAAPGTHNYTVSASAQFTETSPKLGGLEPKAEGIAVDPASGRVYLLTVDAREKGLGVDEGVTSGGGQKEALPVASTLYAFSTKEEGSKLVGAGNQGEHNEILTGPAELEAQSKTPGKSLLEPRGITIDRAKHEVIVLAHVDEKGSKEDVLSGANDHYVLQRIEATGKLGERWVDSTDFFKHGYKPHSPVAVTTSNNGKEEQHVDIGHVVEGVENASEVPYDFKSSAAPHKLVSEPEGGIEVGVFGTEAGTGGRLAAGPEGALYGLGTVRNEASGSGSFAGVVAFDGLDGSELGWTGGQQPGATGACQLEIPALDTAVPPSISSSFAVGSGGDIFVLAPEFLLRQEEVVEEVENPETEEMEEIITFEPLPGPFFPAVVELGPGGTGCQPASATTPVARVNASEVKGEEPVLPGSEVTFSSQIKQADALSVEWNFGDGTAPTTVAGDEYQTTRVKHKYETKGKYTVTEKIRLDNLGDPTQPVWGEGHLIPPTVTKAMTINVNTPVPTAKLTGPTSRTIGESGTFDASTSTDPNKSPITKYSWNFGDGTSVVTTTPSAAHAFGAAGTYTVTLTVTDALELTSAPATVIVHVEAAGGGGGGGGGGGTGTSTGTGTGTSTGTSTSPATSTTPTSSTGATGGVLAYKLSVPSTSPSVTPAGAVVLKLNCGGPSSCIGTVTLRTLTAVSSSNHKKAVLTLASGSFTATGGTVKAVALHLSATARKLLARSHVLRARVTIVARDSQGAMHTTAIVVTLRPAKKHH